MYHTCNLHSEDMGHTRDWAWYACHLWITSSPCPQGWRLHVLGHSQSTKHSISYTQLPVWFSLIFYEHSSAMTVLEKLGYLHQAVGKTEIQIG